MREPRRSILEAGLIAVVGVALAITANAMNPDGLKLGRNYFPQGSGPKTTGLQTLPSTQVPATAAVATRESDIQASANGAPLSNPAEADPLAGLADDIKKKLAAFDLKPIRHARLKELYESPLYQAGLYMVIDARDDKEYQNGHIPGAFHLYYYQEERYANDVVPFAPGAEHVIVYCNGGDCEDSVLAAALLRDKYAVDPARIFVYPEGFESWKKAGLPVERGVRGSGDIIQASQPTAGGH